MKRAATVFGVVLSILLARQGTASDAVVAWSPTAGLALVARGDTRQVTAFVGDSERWSAPGLSSPTALVAGSNKAVVLDALSNRALVVDFASHRSTVHVTAETPVAAVIIGSDTFVLCRDAGILMRIGSNGSESRTAIDRGSSALLSRNGTLLVYSRMSGSISEIDRQTLRVSRKCPVPAFASDIEADSRYAYLTYPQSASILAFDLTTFRAGEPVKTGAVPTDLALTGEGNVLSAGTVAVADPSSKKIWRAERVQSLAAAAGRGFLRGLIGMGLYRPSSSEFPTGVDRVWSAAGELYAYDSSTSTLYRASRQGAKKVGVFDVNSFAFGDGGVIVWNANSGRIQHIR